MKDHFVALADTAKELAEICETNVNVIYSSISHKCGCYRKIYLREGKYDKQGKYYKKAIN